MVLIAERCYFISQGIPQNSVNKERKNVYNSILKRKINVINVFLIPCLGMETRDVGHDIS